MMRLNNYELTKEKDVETSDNESGDFVSIILKIWIQIVYFYFY